MTMPNIDDLSRDDLVKVLARDRFVKEQYLQRIAALTSENVELFGILREMETEAASLREQLAALTTPTGD